jgi:hypothetical protein
VYRYCVAMHRYNVTSRFLELVHFAWLKLSAYWFLTPHFCLPPSPGNHELDILMSRNLTFLDASYKWNQVAFLWLAYFT